MNKKIIAIIPARGGSKRIENKNLYPINGKPLLLHSIQQAKSARKINNDFVSSNDDKILNFAKQNNCDVIKRPENLSTDLSTTEETLIHSLEYFESKFNENVDAIMLLQCTSPVRKASDIDKATNVFLEQDADSLMSVVENSRFVWGIESNKMFSLNYNFKNRPRTQDLNKQYLETGSIYITKKTILLDTKNRLGGKIVPFVMDYITNFEIDDLLDTKIVEWAIKNYY